MRTLITPQAMRAGEARYFASSGVPSIEVMERAATALAERIASELPVGATIYFACGTGGNGGDGSACARLSGRGAAVPHHQLHREHPPRIDRLAGA